MKVFRFEHPEYLFAAAIVIVLYIIWFVVRSADRKAFLKIGEPALIKRLIKGESQPRKNMKFFMVNFAVVMIPVALQTRNSF